MFFFAGLRLLSGIPWWPEVKRAGAGLSIRNLLEVTYNDFFTLKNVTCKGLIRGTRRGGDAELTLPLALLSRSAGLCPTVLVGGVAQGCSSKNTMGLGFLSFFSPLFFLPRSFLWSPSHCHTPCMHIYAARARHLSWLSCHQQETQFLAMWGKPCLFYPGNTAYAILFGSLLSIYA